MTIIWTFYYISDLLIGISDRLNLMFESNNYPKDHLYQVLIVFSMTYGIVFFLIAPLSANVIEKRLYRRRHHHDRGVGDSAPQQ